MPRKKPPHPRRVEQIATLLEDIVRRLKREPPPLSAIERAVLEALEPRLGGRSGSDLARELGLAKSTVFEAVGRLVALGYAERLPAPCDRRRIDLRSTPAGERRLGVEIDRARLEQAMLLTRPFFEQRATDTLRTIADAASGTDFNPRPGRRRSLDLRPVPQ